MSTNSKETSADKRQKPKRSKQPANPQEALLATTSEQFKDLCRLALEIQQLQPWRYMEETDVFGVQDPDTGDQGFVSIMGALGEYQSVAVYRGNEGLYGWIDFEDLLDVDPESDQAHDMLMEIPQLQLAFLPAGLIEKRDRDVIKNSGLKFASAKPVFRCYRPGYLPWFLTGAEASHLIHVLTQTIDVARRFYDDPGVVSSDEDAECEVLMIRVPEIHDSKIAWKDQVQRVDPPATKLIPFSVDDAVLKRLRAMPKRGALEADLFIAPAILGKPNERPRALYMLLVADSDTGFLYGCEALEAQEGIDLLYASIPEKIAEMLLRTDIGRPVQFAARSEKILDVLESLASELSATLSLADELPAIDEAKSALFNEMGFAS